MNKDKIIAIIDNEIQRLVDIPDSSDSSEPVDGETIYKDGKNHGAIREAIRIKNIIRSELEENAFKNYFMELYGDGLEVANWHLNGDTEPLDNFIESALEAEEQEGQKMIQDSGERKQFESGAVRDIQEGKGRCDLLPLGTIGECFEDVILEYINAYIVQGEIDRLKVVLEEFAELQYSGSYETMLLEVARHYEEGAKKYTERNWEKGIPVHCFLDSAVRHYLKYKRGDTDERHDRAFIWNILGAMWTHENKPELIDLPFVGERRAMDESDN